MSHFTVLVIGDDVEGQLAPYHEYECTGRFDEYVSFVDETEEVRARYETNKSKYVRLPGGEVVSAYDARFYRATTPEERAVGGFFSPDKVRIPLPDGAEDPDEPDSPFTDISEEMVEILCASGEVLFVGEGWRQRYSVLALGIPGFEFTHSAEGGRAANINGVNYRCTDLAEAVKKHYRGGRVRDQDWGAVMAELRGKELGR